MQRTIILSGIGGQGVQFAAQTTCRAAALEGRQAQYFSFVGGVMRGGMSSAYVVLAHGAIDTPPWFGRGWAGIPLHTDHAGAVLDNMTADSLIVADSRSVRCADSPARLLDVPFLRIAKDAGAPAAMSLVAVSALAAATRLVQAASLVAGMEASLPPYRRRHAGANADAIQAGYVSAEPIATAWNAAEGAA